MAKGNFPHCLKFTLQYEGGYSDHRADPGGSTNHGVTRATLARWKGRPVTKAEVKALTKAEAAQIYEQYYWKPVRGDELPLGVDLVVFDYGVNSGTGRSAIALQRCASVADDGKIGPLTLKAVKAVLPAVLVDRVCAERLGFLTRLSTWRVFGRGWKRRVDACEAAARKMLPVAKGRESKAKQPAPAEAAADDA